MEIEPSEYCFCVIDARESLKRLENNFYTALSLFTHFRSKMGLVIPSDPKSNYQFSEVAARDAISTIYYFRNSLTQLANNVPKCPETKDTVNLGLIYKAQELYNNYFPEAPSARHGIAHASQAMARPENARTTSLPDAEDNAVGAPPKVIRRSGFQGHLITVTHQGKEWSADISEGTLKKLQEIRKLTVDAFGFDVHIC
ncbi:hypothetical protein JK202_10915 [Gluconobacter sp. Dm-62]|uniref:hypothetical protein n=1 Tax=Gluconobacter sp. Dm-62 TaxID=2799804 RepID=UPI001B8BEFF0|nr:hypothetical protein [Gluconobacter sp. Dm-62]MBS1103520.1 hypothetical protein [Gluconobacter sp. Dm-62]